MSRRFLNCLILLCVSWSLQAQTTSFEIKSIGIPLIENFGSSEYDAEVNNYDILVGDDQRIYVGNEQGILIHDGQEWQLVELPNNGAVYSLIKSSTGVIYVGGVTESGFLKSNDNGIVTYQSLNPIIYQDTVPSSVRVVTEIGDKVVSLSSYDISFIDPQTNSVTSFTQKRWPGEGCRAVFGEKKFYCICENDLFELKETGWELLRKPKFAEHVDFALIGPITVGDKKVIVTKNGFYDFDTEEVLSINPQVTSFLADNYVYRVKRLPNDYLAICSWNGLLITDSNGEPIQLIKEEMGLANNYVFAADMDNSGVLWVATYNGVSKIALTSEFTFIDERTGAHNGIVHDMTIFEKDLYFATMQGTFRGSWSTMSDPFNTEKFEKIDDLLGHRFVHHKQALIMTSELTGAQVMENSDRFTSINGTEEAVYWACTKFRDSEDVLFAGFEGFMVHARKVNNRWQGIKKFDPSFQSAELVVQGEGQDVWISGKADGLYKIKYDRQNQSIIEEKKYLVADGLPSDQNNYVFEINGEPYFGTEKGIYRYDKIADRLVMDPVLKDLVGDIPVKIMRQKGQDLYFISDRIYYLDKTKDSYNKRVFSNLDYKKYLPTNFTVIDDENVLIGSPNGVVHLNPGHPNPSSHFSSRITGLKSLESDSIFYGGFGSIPELQFGPHHRSFRIKFTSDFHQGESDYKWKLNGLDEKWSNWSNETSKDYTNLSPGEYSFQLVSRNVFGQESALVSLSFVILPPWYLNTWAYLLYIMLGAGFIYGVVIAYSKRLKSENKKLEEKVALRTQQLSDQTEELQKQNDLKKRFFVNISHELKTPLTLTLGTLERSINKSYGHINSDLEKNLKIAFNNSERLLKMVNSILDISRLEGGNTQLKVSKVNPKLIIDKVLAFFDSKFLNKGIQLEKATDLEVELYLDADKFETILINLVSNAFKFTPENGVIRVSMMETDSSIQITVKDSGNGIPEKDLPFVFDRFYQSPSIKSGEGLGVGLALTKELVDLHHGEVSVTNEYGAKFVIAFKKGSEHLSKEEIANDGDMTTSNLASKYHLNEVEDLSPELAETTGNQAHLLLVEDNPELQTFIGDLLSDRYTISKAANGKQALKILKQLTPDLIISDYMMPEMDGYQFAQAVKKVENLAHVPLIFLTARTDEEDKLSVLNLGVDDYIFKPFNPEELLIRINNLLFSKKSRLEYIEEEGLESEEIQWKDFQSDLRSNLDQFINENLGIEITSDQLSQATGQSERSLYRKVKSNTGLSLLGYVKEYRLRKARTMLETKTFATVSEVAYAVGYKYLSHFTKNFKERYGHQPSEYF